jgi:predicted DNA binding CopG/RHH family protein
MPRKKLPKFIDEKDEQKFWSSHDSAGYLDWNKAKNASFPNLKPTLRSISIRLPEMMIQNLRTIAKKRDVPYQSLIKTVLQDRIDEEFGKKKI